MFSKKVLCYSTTEMLNVDRIQQLCISLNTYSCHKNVSNNNKMLCKTDSSPAAVVNHSSKHLNLLTAGIRPVVAEIYSAKCFIHFQRRLENWMSKLNVKLFPKSHENRFK